MNNEKFDFENLKVYQKGFTLIEIIVLIVLVGIILPAIIVPFATGIKGSGKPEMVNKAMFLAQQKMEEFMKFNYSNPALTPTATAYIDTGFTGFSNYQWKWSIAWVDSSSSFADSSTDVGYKKILVWVQDPEDSTYVVTSVVTHFP